MRARLVLCVVLILMAPPIRAGERLALKVSPSVSFAPADLVVRTTVEADAANRGMEVIAESADFYSASAIQLDGIQAPRTTLFEFRSLPSGTYLVRATLVGSDGRARANVRQQVNVIASGSNR
jgi:hypothetical protein